MNIGDKLIYIAHSNRRTLVYGKTYTLSEICEMSDNDNYNDSVCLVEEEYQNTYFFMSDFISIKEYRKLKLQKINESRR